MTIQDYDISMEHYPGKNNSAADTLSRLSGNEDGEKVNHGNSKIILYALAKRLSSKLRNRLQNFSQEQKLEPTVQQKINGVEEKKTNKYEIVDGCQDAEGILLLSKTGKNGQTTFINLGLMSNNN